MTAPTLTEFLLARLDVEELSVAQAIAEVGATEAHAKDWHWVTRKRADVQAKRTIIRDLVPAIANNDRAVNGEWNAQEDCAGDLLRAMAVVYSDHPDYDEAWRP